MSLVWMNFIRGQKPTKKRRMRQRQRNMSDPYENEEEETRPFSDSAYDNSDTSIRNVTNRLQNNRPLTRYLPVRGENEEFNLKQHLMDIHQLELCPHIIVNETSARGYLSKRSRFHNWNKRWFVFDRVTRTLSYYMDKGEKKARGGVHFQAIEEVYKDHLQKVKSPSPKQTFCVKTYNRVYYLISPSPEAMRIWIDVIFTGAEGYQEFKS